MLVETHHGVSLLIRRVLATLLAFLLSPAVFADDCGIERPVRFDPLLFLFRGRVVEIVGPVSSPYLDQDAWALEISVEFAAHVPDSETSYVVVPVRIGEDCGRTAMSRSELANLYRTGEKVSVVAQRSEVFSGHLEAIINRYQEVFKQPEYRVFTESASQFEPRPFKAQVVDSWYGFHYWLKKMPGAVSDEHRAAYARAMIPFISDAGWFEKIIEIHLIDRQLMQDLYTEHRNYWINGTPGNGAKAP